MEIIEARKTIENKFLEILMLKKAFDNNLIDKSNYEKLKDEIERDYKIKRVLS